MQWVEYIIIIVVCCVFGVVRPMYVETLYPNVARTSLLPPSCPSASQPLYPLPQCDLAR
jgi:hypothetical protein